jgi:hypothetical protein
LWLTSRRLLEEVDRQRHEAWVVFTRMEQMGLQPELYGSCFTASPVQGRSEWSTPSLSSQPSYSPLSKLLKPVTSILVGDNVMNNNFLLYMLLPYVFHLTYLNMSLPAGVHESPNTCATCVCLMVTTPFSPVYPTFNMLIMHVHVTLLLLFKPVVSRSIFLSFSLRI